MREYPTGGYPSVNGVRASAKTDAFALARFQERWFKRAVNGGRFSAKTANFIDMHEQAGEANG